MAEPDDTIMSGMGGAAGGGLTGLTLGHIITQRKLQAELLRLTWQHLAWGEAGATITAEGDLAQMAARRFWDKAFNGYVLIGLASGVAGGIAGHFAADYVEQQTGSEAAGTAAGVVAGAVTGMAVGAAIGSIVPGVGTAAGAAVGAVCGAIGGFIGSLF